MRKKNIYLIQAGFAFDQSLYFPCAAGALAAYALQDAVISERYVFKDFIFRREKLDEAAGRMESPYLAGFSCCVWNYEYNKALAKKIKAFHPECLIVFGGHHVTPGGAMLEKEEYVDILVHGEGEETFAQLLAALGTGALNAVNGISYRENGSVVSTPEAGPPALERCPSAYLSGVFDNLIAENRGTDFLAVLETNRGCPYRCSYCDWCAGKTVRFFPMERIKAEIDWLAENKIEYCFCADANFGMYRRDLEIVDYLVEAKRRTGYPKVFRPCYAKNSDDNVFEISRKLNSVEMDKGATLAYQTLSDDALGNVNRLNLTLDKFAGLLAKYNAAGIPSYSELILGLPGETYDSFCDGICGLLEAGQHNSISVYHCEMLPNSEMAQPAYIKKHGIRVAKMPFNHIHSAEKDEEVTEYSYLVVGTNTLNGDQWVKANLFSILVQCFHNLGLLRCFAIYQRNENGLKYIDFYRRLLEFAVSAKGTLVYELFERFRKEFENLTDGKWMYRNELFGEGAWFPEEGAFLEILLQYDRFWYEIKAFLDTFHWEDGVYADLAVYQRAIVKRPGTQAVVLTLAYDWYGYFDGVYAGKREAPVKRGNILRIAGNATANWKDYARETVWYGRRRGATLHTSNKGETETEYLAGQTRPDAGAT